MIDGVQVFLVLLPFDLEITEELKALQERVFAVGFLNSFDDLEDQLGLGKFACLQF